MAVGTSWVAPKTVLLGFFGFCSPGGILDERDAATDYQHDAAKFPVTTSEAAIHRWIRVTRSVIVTVAPASIAGFPHHIGVLLELGLRVRIAVRSKIPKPTKCAVLNIG